MGPDPLPGRDRKPDRLCAPWLAPDEVESHERQRDVAGHPGDRGAPRRGDPRGDARSGGRPRRRAGARGCFAHAVRRPAVNAAAPATTHGGVMKMPYVRFRPRHGAVLVALLAALGLSLAGCKGGTEIKTLLDDPGRFDGTVVRVAGKV